MRSVMYCDTEAMIRSTEKSIPDVSPRWRVCPFTSSVKCRDCTSPPSSCKDTNWGERAAERSNALQRSHGSPSAMACRCRSRAVKSMPSPTWS